MSSPGLMPSPDYTPSLRLDGRTALVTGAGRGLGRSISDTLHALGAHVIGTSRNPTDAQEIAERLGTIPVVLDVSDPTSLSKTLEHLVDSNPSIDLLVNNAGINSPEPATRIEPSTWDEVYDTNVRGSFLVSQFFGKRWIESDTKGVICMVSSQAGRVAIEQRAAYSSSKAAVDQLTKNLAFEWGPHGIRVNAVAPTFVRTELTASTLADPELGQVLVNRIPLGRFGEPHEVAASVAFLLSDSASLITGHTLVVDGGYTIH